MATQIKLRRDSYQNWYDNNPLLSQGEPIYDLTNKRLKIGDGVTLWRDLAYFDVQQSDLSAYAGNILPSVDNTYNIGSPDKRWQHGFFADGSLYIGNIKLSNVNGRLVVQEVVNPGDEFEEPVPDTPGAVTTDRLVNSAKEIVLDANGSLTVPSPISTPFPLVFSAANYVPTVGKPTLTLTATPWALTGQYAYAPDGRAALALDNIWPTVINPGYESGDAFTFDSSVHGISGFILTITLNSVVLAGPAGWTANVSESAPPVYQSTIESNGAIKLTSNINSLILGTDGTVTVSGAIKQGISKLDLNADGSGNVYLTTTTDDTTALFMNSTGIQTFAKESVSLYAGTTLAALETAYNNKVIELDAAFAVDGWTGAGYPAGPTSSQALNAAKAMNPLIPDVWITIATELQTAYNTWQNALDNTSVSIGVSSGSWAFKPNGSFAINNNEVHIGTNNWGQIAFANANTVIYTQKSNTNLASIRVHATIEGDEDGDTTGLHSQACDMMIVRRVSNGGVSTVDSVVYGVIYTGAGPLATLDAQWNAVTNKIEITATPVSTTTNVFVKIYATEVARGD